MDYRLYPVLDNFDKSFEKCGVVKKFRNWSIKYSLDRMPAYFHNNNDSLKHMVLAR